MSASNAERISCDRCKFWRSARGVLDGGKVLFSASLKEQMGECVKLDDVSFALVTAQHDKCAQYEKKVVNGL